MFMVNFGPLGGCNLLTCMILAGGLRVSPRPAGPPTGPTNWDVGFEATRISMNCQFPSSSSGRQLCHLNCSNQQVWESGQGAAEKRRPSALRPPWRALPTPTSSWTKPTNCEPCVYIIVVCTFLRVLLLRSVRECLDCCKARVVSGWGFHFV
jgi:hypothetical protein